MKYAIKYYKTCPILKDADEIIIVYDKKSTQLLDFVKNHQEQRVIADITKLNDAEASLELLIAAARTNSNFTVLLSLTQEDLIPLLKENSINFFFREGADTKDMLSLFINLGVSDIYVTSELAFEIKQVSALCKKNNIKVRVYPNIAQSSLLQRHSVLLDSFKFFFIMPQAVELYEDYVDVFEFKGPLDKQPVLYRIYNEGMWKYDLRYIILGLKEEVYGACFPYISFTEKRLECGKNCIYSNCSYCDTMKSLAREMKKKNYILTYDKEKNEYEHRIDESSLEGRDERDNIYDDELPSI